MRYRYEEYSPQNKKQYVIAVGVHELRALFDAASRVLALSPERTLEQRHFKTALQSSVRGLKEAIKVAEVNEDDGKRRKVYVGEGALDKKCETCDGQGHYDVMGAADNMDFYTVDCTNCSGTGRK